MIVKEVKRLVNDEKYFKSLAGTSKQADVRKIEADRTTLMQKIDALDLQISRVVDLYQLGIISIQEIGQRTRQLQDEKAALQKTRDGIVIPEDDRLSVDEAQAILPKCAIVLVSDDMEAKRAMLKKVIQKIVVKPKVGEIDIHWNF